MKLCTYRFADGTRAALVDGRDVVDVVQASAALPTSLAALLAAGPQALELVRAHAATAPRAVLDVHRLEAPIPDPRIFFAAGLNYRDHAAEVGRKLGDTPHLFTKIAGTVAPPFGQIGFHAGDDTLDYEGELGFVIGRRCRAVSLNEAPGCIAGYVVVNDLSLRALLAPETLVLAKGGAGYGPCGPWLTTSDEVADPHNLNIRTWVNGELRQDSNTRELHVHCYALLSFISQHVTLEPGDMVTTGSPSGSGISFKPPRYLGPGDKVKVEIEGLGHIENAVVALSAQPPQRHRP